MNQVQTIDSLMEQAQVFASAWSLVGGMFDKGQALDEAQSAKTELREMLTAALAHTTAVVHAKPAAMAVPASSRDAFEVWAPTEHMRTERWKPNPELYDDENAISAWQGWEAGVNWVLSATPALPATEDSSAGGQAVMTPEMASAALAINSALYRIRAGRQAEAIEPLQHALFMLAKVDSAAAPQDQPADAQLERLQTLINSPELHNFLRGVHLEAVHQVERWGEAPDRQKRPADWFWLVGYLAGKVLHAVESGNQDKALHHCISTAAALYNWHCAIKGQDVRQLPSMSDVEQIINQAFPGEADAEQ